MLPVHFDQLHLIDPALLDSMLPEEKAVPSTTVKALIKVTTAKKAIKIKTSLRTVPPIHNI